MGAPSTNDQEARIAAIRRFNRFYTRKIGVLEQQLLESPYSLTEARVLFELAHRDEPTAKEIGAQLDLDPGYLSRIVQAFMEKGLVTRKPVPSDRRQFRLALTTKGRLAFGRLNRSSHDEVGVMLEKLPGGGEERLVAAMTTIERLLDDHRAALDRGLPTDEHAAKFHVLLAEATRNQVFVTFMGSILDLLRARGRTGRLSDELRETELAEHREILRLVRARDQQAAADYVTGHIVRWAVHYDVVLAGKTDNK